MGERRHKHRAEQHPARLRRDQLRRLHRVRLPAVVMLICAVTVIGLLITSIVWGVASDTAGGLEVAAFFVACIVFIHQLVVHVLPVSTESEYSEPGITERGVAYGVSPTPGWFNRIDRAHQAAALAPS